MIERAFKKYEFDPKACSKKLICWFVHDSIENVKKDQANRLDKFVDGFSRFVFCI